MYTNRTRRKSMTEERNERERGREGGVEINR